ncbi:MAG: class I SAM-dependent methyltransferase [bacterium]
MKTDHLPVKTPFDAKLLPPISHPNYQLWRNYAQFARARGELAADILESFQPLKSRTILDIGCGEGGTACALAARGARVRAIDFNPARVKKLQNQLNPPNLTVELGHAEKLKASNACFDVIILQDVLEHLPHPEKAVSEMCRVLKPNGLLYLSTPNRWSPFNFLSDPHWNLPMVSALSRKWVKIFITQIVRREHAVRADFAALLSLYKIRKMFSENQIALQFVNKKVTQRLFEQPHAVVNSEFHLRIIRWLNSLGLKRPFTTVVNDRFGLFNFIINPTWYFVGQKMI